MTSILAFTFVMITAFSQSGSGDRSFGSDDPRRYEEAIQRFEEQDRKSPPKPGGILFIGSSSIKMWGTLERDMAPLPVINRGFGGSKIPDVVHFAPRVVLPYRPKMIVLYAGDNDMSYGKIASPAAVLRSFDRFRRLIGKALPKARIYFVSIKPSGSRWRLWPGMRAANRLIRRLCSKKKRLTYIDVSSPMLDKKKRLRNELFLDDRLHLNAQGYAEWTSIIRPILKRDLGRR